MNAEVSPIPLLPCPSCNFNDETYKKMRNQLGGMAPKKSEYLPILYRNRLLNKWVIECQYCGMTVVFLQNEYNPESMEESSARLWNLLPRNDTK